MSQCLGRDPSSMDLVVLDPNHKALPWDAKANMWFMSDRPQPVTMSMPLDPELLPLQPPEVQRARNRAFVVELATNIEELRVEPECGDYPSEAFVLADPGEPIDRLEVLIDWRLRRFVDLPDFMARLEELVWWKFAPPPSGPFASRRERAVAKRMYAGFREAEKEAHRCLWRLAERLAPAPRHYFPMEIRDGGQVTMGVVGLKEWTGDRFLANLFLLGPRAVVHPGTELRRRASWRFRGKRRRREVLLGVVSKVI
ncbi:MAG TPA: hypothetical protein EYP14_15800 [Planctomycetaceae bacterium]|nr:hypothetical protein [Planctomycetaceae bacterium]